MGEKALDGLLTGRNALVTGGSRGLGRAICLTLAREGANVAFNFTRAVEEAEQLKQQLLAMGVKAWAFQVSVLDKAGLQQMVRSIEQEAGTIDILVNNAGIGQVVPLALMEEEDWDKMMNTNVKGAFLTTQAVLRGMIHQKRGRILNISSLAGVKMMQAPVHYSAAKAALKGMTEALAKEVGGYGITVNCLAPGVLNEGVSGNLPPAKQREYIGHCALGRLGTVEEIAEVVAFFVSDKNSYMNGATTVIDGGV
jgi:NAD(P)-dependent dehydrogenase (short-subunit alcohol dehydrogenase family)